MAATGRLDDVLGRLLGTESREEVVRDCLWGEQLLSSSDVISLRWDRERVDVEDG